MAQRFQTFNPTYNRFFQQNQLGLYFPGTETSSGGSGKFETIFGGAIGLLSQLIGAKGSRPTTQIVQQGNTTIPIGGGYDDISQQTQQQYQQTQYPSNTNGLGANAVNTASGFVDGLAASFGVSTSVLFLGVGLGAYLLLRPSPVGRR